MAKKWRKMICFFIATFCLLIGIIYWFDYTQRLTPEMVVNAFANAGYTVNALQAVEKYPGPFSDRTIVDGGEFEVTLSDNTVVHIYVFSYAIRFNAIYVTRESNALNRRMNGTFAYAYRRGKVVISVRTFDQDTAQELSRVFLEK